MDAKLTLEELLQKCKPYEIIYVMAEICYQRRMNSLDQCDLPKAAYWSDQQALFEAATFVVRENELRLLKRDAQ